MPSAIANKSNNPTITIILAAAHHRTMPHRRVFAPLREPLRHDPQLQLQPDQVRGACPFLNPTHAIFMPIIEAPQTEPPVAKEQQQQQGPSRAAHPNQIRYLWRSRDNRKGRHALQVQHHALYALPRNTNGLRAVLAGLWRMATVFPYWDVSYLVAFIFTLGSVIWVINAFFVWLPLEDPSSEFSNESSTAGGVTAFVGATVFEIGSILLVLEAVNENSAGCFGWALERVLRDQADELLDVLQPDNHACQHHHVNRRAFLSGRQQAITTSGRTFTWLPSWNELRTHYMRELGFLASMAQLIGATIFWISGFTCLPGIINHMSQGLTDGVFWVPQIVGGSLFVISGYAIQ